MITTQQAKIFLNLLHGNRFNIAWKYFYQNLFYRVFNNQKPFNQQFNLPQIVSFISSIDDLALIALNCDNNHCQECFELIKDTLSTEQLIDLLKCMLKLAASGSIAPRNLPDMLRGDTIPSYILDELLKPTKKKLASQIEHLYYNYIDLISQDILKDKSPPDNIPADYDMSIDCQNNSIALLISINQEIDKFLNTNPVIIYFLGLIKNFAQQDKTFPTNNLNQFLLGTLANRVVSSMFNRYIKRYSIKTIQNLSKNSNPNNPHVHLAKKSEFQRKVAVRYGMKLFTDLISGDLNEKSSQKNVYPSQFHEFIADPKNKNLYLAFCTNINVSENIACPKLDRKIKNKFVPKAQSDAYGQELHIILWLAIKEIYFAYQDLKPKMQLPAKLAEQGNELKFRYLPTCIIELRNLLDGLLNISTINNPEGALIRELIEKLNILERYCKENLAYIPKEHLPDSKSPPRWTLSPRNSTEPMQPISANDRIESSSSPSSGPTSNPPR